MKTLTLKIFRDLKAKKWQFLAVTFLVFLGISLFSGLYSSYLNIGSTYKKFYAQTDFEDIGATFNPLPEKVVEEIKSIPGVAAVGRLTAYATTEVNGREVNLKLVSIDKNSPVDRVYVVKGKYEENGVLLLSKFAKLNDICVGEVLKVKLNGKTYSLRVTGTACSPEYVLLTENEFSTPKDFGVVFVPYHIMEKITGMKGKVNEVHVRVYSGNVDEVFNRIKEILGPNLKSIYKRVDQPSYKLLRMDLEGFREIAIMFPCMLLIVAILSAYVLLSRIVMEQKGVIAVLRAIGYSKRTVIAHYIYYSLLIGLVGTLPGIIAGYAISASMTKSYIELLNLPYSVLKIYPDVTLISILAGVLTPAIAGFSAAKKAAEIEPASAMKTVDVGKVVKKIKRISILSPLTRMAIKNVFRNPKRSLYSLFGVAMAVMLIATSIAMLDSTENMINLQFNKIQTFDYEVKTSNLSAIKSLKDVIEAYPIVKTWIVIKRNGIVKKSEIIGLPVQNLYNIYDMEGKKLFPPTKGLIIPESIARNLSISEGEYVKALTNKGYIEFKVYKIVKQPLVPSCYASLKELEKLGFKPNYVIVKGGNEFELKKFGSVVSMKRAKKNMEEMMGMMYTFFLFSVMFGVSLSFAEVFNTNITNVLERKREFATLLMLGYTVKEIAYTMVIETYVVGLPGIALGFPLAMSVLQLFKETYKNDVFHMPFVMDAKSYIVTVVVIFLTLAISIIPAIKYVAKMNIAEVTRETPE